MKMMFGLMVAMLMLAGVYGAYTSVQPSCSGSTSLDIYTKGSVTYTTSNNGRYIATDQCVNKNTVGDYRCNGNSMEYQEAACPVGYKCKDGACEQEVIACLDSDGGYSIFEKGTITGIDRATGESKTQTESCESTTMLNEYACDNGYINAYKVFAPSGYSCKDGAFVKVIALPDAYLSCSETDGGNSKNLKGTLSYSMRLNGTEISGSYTDQCIDSRSVNEYYCEGNQGHKYTAYCDDGYSCSNGACVKTVTRTCTDMDGGFSSYVASYLIYRNENGTYQLNDECANATSIRERGCLNGEPKTYEFDCGATIINGVKSQSICIAGACVKQPLPCSDTDGGVNIYKQGKLNGTLPNGDEFRNSVVSNNYQDHCINNRKVSELYCDADGLIAGRDYECPSGSICSNGACVEMTSCLDSDGGYSIFEKGTIIGIDRATGESKTQTESCESTTMLNEYACDNGYINAYKVFAPSGYSCKDGAFVKVIALPDAYLSCSETDGGNSKNLKGTLSYSMRLNGTEISGSYTDQCIDSRSVNEYYCEGNQGHKYTAYCDDGYSCSNGACILQTTADEAEKYTLNLYKGWNLISIPYHMYYFDSTTCGSGVKAYYYDPAENEYADATSRFSTASAGGSGSRMGVWVKAPAECSITFKVSDVLTPENLFSDAGGPMPIKNGDYSAFDPGRWLLLGTANSATTWDYQKGTCTAEKGPWKFDAKNQQWMKATTLNPGEGFFVKIQSDCMLGASANDQPPAMPQ